MIHATQWQTHEGRSGGRGVRRTFRLLFIPVANRARNVRRSFAGGLAIDRDSKCRTDRSTKIPNNNMVI